MTRSARMGARLLVCIRRRGCGSPWGAFCDLLSRCAVGAGPVATLLGWRGARPPRAARGAAGAVDQPPRPLLGAAAIVAVESLVALSYAVWLLVEAFVGSPRERGQAVAVAVTFLLLAAPLP